MSTKIKFEPSFVSYECDNEVILQKDVIKTESLDESCENSKVKQQSSNGLMVEVEIANIMGIKLEHTSYDSEPRNSDYNEQSQKHLTSIKCENTDVSQTKALCKDPILTRFELSQMNTNVNTTSDSKIDIESSSFRGVRDVDVKTSLNNCKNNVKNHMSKKIHANDKPYVCEECNRGFKRLDYLKRHQLTHTGIKQFSCDVCSKAFVRRHDLNNHKTIHNKVKSNVCEVCDKGFVSPSNLRVHRLTHTGEKRFPCDVCEKGFRQLQHLRAHRLTHIK